MPRIPILILIVLLLWPTASPALQSWPLPATQPAAQPSLSKSPDGHLNLSWIERTDHGHRLQFARYRHGRWTATQTIAQGNDWFVNWADFPSTSTTADGTLWAHNLVKRGKGSYAYDVVLYRSRDGGRHWSKPMTVHDDRTQSEHGFATLWPWSKNEIAIAWLDGRHTVTGNDHTHHDTPHTPQTADMEKAMTLRAATINHLGRKTNEWLLDSSTCDCCQTDSAVSQNGPVLIYRNRNEHEIRDVYITRYVAGRWQAPQLVAADNWHMPACPVNGPALSANGSSLWAAWYTGAGAQPALRVAYSNNNGVRFKHHRRLVQSSALQGRVDIQADAEGAWLMWTEESDRQRLWLQRLDEELNTPAPAQRIAVLQGRGRATGFARMQQVNGRVYVVWTDIVAGKPMLRGAQLSAK
jgi:hypothetical protein